MSAGEIVLVDWRDAIPGSGEPNKKRPAIVVGSPKYFRGAFPFEIVVPLTGEPDIALRGASLAVDPTPENGCTKKCYALAWSIQTVPHARISRTKSRITALQLAEIRKQIATCVAAS